MTRAVRALLVTSLVAGATLVVVAAPTAATVERASTVSPGQWSSSVCASLGRWEQELAKSGSTKSPANPTAGRAAIVTYLGQAVQATSTLVKQIRSAGVPAGKDGAAINAALRTTIDDLRVAYVTAQTAAAQLPISDPTTFANAARTLATQLRAGTPLNTIVVQLAARYPSSGVAKTFGSTSQCKRL